MRNIALFKKIAVTTQVLYQTLLQATHASAANNAVTADSAELLHEASRLLATIANSPNGDAQAHWLALSDLAVTGSLVCGSITLETTKEDTASGQG